MCGDLDCKVEMGYCHCGCGQPAPVAKKTTTKYGHIKGQPIRFINGHYQRSTRLSPVDYVLDSVTGCWAWQRSRLPSGHGQLRDGGRMGRAHRVYDERYRGAIPAGLHLDHLCKNPACVNSVHLEPVTPIDEANTIRVAAGRACRECQRLANRESQRKRRARLAASGKTYARKLIEGFPPIDYWVDPSSGCRVWQRYLGPEGYALKRRDGKRIPAHRYYYETYRGPIPAGLIVDHLCRNRACVNPYHLEAVTAQENAARRDRAKRKSALRVLR